MGDRGIARWSVYVVRCGDGTLYTGIATDVARRMAEHARSGGRGAKYLRGRGPLRLVLEKKVGSRALALKIESRIKRFSKARKEAMVGRDADGAPQGTGRKGGGCGTNMKRA